FTHSCVSPTATTTVEPGSANGSSEQVDCALDDALHQQWYPCDEQIESRRHHSPKGADSFVRQLSNQRSHCFHGTPGVQPLNRRPAVQVIVHLCHELLNSQRMLMLRKVRDNGAQPRNHLVAGELPGRKQCYAPAVGRQGVQVTSQLRTANTGTLPSQQFAHLASRQSRDSRLLLR